ncbi:transglutaminase domain-containing protein [Alkalilimnicola ehrlichii MLHE-1]|uniref:Transglutaminase domain protein n=1 Tax=Alkalilimnicola ehrlichii (strain ATCC BAA-1101 / DSM 17681 / MLHE-1) TaxID=187272 RepID=Q0AAK7_ALKEH|nr:transglutaminase domain-containing protein [Alkalilimnicola ehrlichii]ABI56130.1 transglutaminase domain protein [Alkalilimnicola ehrlichii MLHE-1]
MWLRTACEIQFHESVPAPFVLMLRPRSGKHQWVGRETYVLQPNVPAVEYTDAYGNLCQRLVSPPGAFLIRTSADVYVPDQGADATGAPFVEVQDLPDDALTYLLPSRYCESDRFLDMAWSIVGDAHPGYDQVARIEAWIREHVHFNPDSPHFQLSAVELNQAREGVCREFAHLGIALCRALCVPARMAVGYLHGLQPMDFHAWFEAYVGGRWCVFDATQPPGRRGRVTVAYGRDAADVAIYNQFGPPMYPTRISVTVDRLEGPPAV